jgi:hypothetical protein
MAKRKLTKAERTERDAQHAQMRRTRSARASAVSGSRFPEGNNVAWPRFGNITRTRDAASSTTGLLSGSSEPDVGLLRFHLRVVNRQTTSGRDISVIRGDAIDVCATHRTQPPTENDIECGNVPWRVVDPLL